MIVLGLISGILFGFVLARGDVCVHSMFRSTAEGRPNPLPRAYMIAIALQVPVLAVLASVIDPYIPPFRPLSNIVGGLIFGAGLVIAASCVSGLFTKLGQGMIGAAVGVAGWAAGDVLATSGPIGALNEALSGAVPSATVTVPSLLGPAGWLLVIAIGAAGIWLLRLPDLPNGTFWSARTTGIGIAVVCLLGWGIATLAGQRFAYGSVGAAASVVRLAGGSGVIEWNALILVGLVIGSVIAGRVGGTGWIRGETRVRYLRLAIGGVVLGIGASIAGGCSIGHVLVGVPLLSVGSLVSTIAMVGGVWLASHVRISRPLVRVPA